MGNVENLNFGRLVKRLKNFAGGERRYKKLQSYKIASEAVLLFVNSSVQEPIASYSADSPSVFDLSQQKLGTIYRVELVDNKMLSGYFWFVVGEMREGMVDLFRVRHRDKKESLLAGERLRLGRSWELAGIHRTKSNSFRIEDAIDVLLISGREPPVEIKVVKLDVMSSGLK